MFPVQVVHQRKNSTFNFFPSLKLTVLPVESFLCVFFLPITACHLHKPGWICGVVLFLIMWLPDVPPLKRARVWDRGYGKNLCPCMPCVRHALYEQQRHVIPCPVFDLLLLYLVSRGKDYSISSNPAKAVMGYISWNTAQVRAGLLDRGAIAIVVQSGAMVTQPNWMKVGKLIKEQLILSDHIEIQVTVLVAVL